MRWTNERLYCKSTAADDQVRFSLPIRKMLWRRLTEYNTSPVATAALGRLLTAMMGSMCKNEQDLITPQIKCSGPIGGLTVTVDSKSKCKGYAVHPDVMPPSKEGKLDGALDLGC